MRWLIHRPQKPTIAQLNTVRPICILDGEICPIAAVRDGVSRPGEPCNRACALTLRETP